jgi:lipid-A-disaccharide synthase
VPLEVIGGEERYARMRECGLILAASGTVSMESALLGTPMVVAYRLSALTYFLAKRLVRVPFVSLPNIILGRAVFPELLQDEATADKVAAAAREWLGDPERLAAVRRELLPLKELCGPPGAVQRAAAIVLRTAYLA